MRRRSCAVTIDMQPLPKAPADSRVPIMSFQLRSRQPTGVGAATAQHIATLRRATYIQFSSETVARQRNACETSFRPGTFGWVELRREADPIQLALRQNKPKRRLSTSLPGTHLPTNRRLAGSHTLSGLSINAYAFFAQAFPIAMDHMWVGDVPGSQPLPCRSNLRIASR
jgi:hypothetical protein